MKEDWYIYILYSEVRQKTYVGCSSDVAQRLKQHNSGGVRATKSGIPWIIIYTEYVASYKEARNRERYYKTGAGRKKIAKIFAEKYQGIK